MAYSLDLKEQLDPRLLPWAGVTSREMFGALCYFHGDKMFVIVTGSSVAVKLSEEERQDALDNHGATEFVVSSGRPFGQWVQFPISEPYEIDPAMDWIEKSYRYVEYDTAPRRSKRRSRRVVG